MAEGDQGGSGINVELSSSNLAPPSKSDSGSETDPAGPKADEGKSAPAKDKKVPLSKNVVKFPILAGSRAVAEVLEYPRFAFTEEEADALAAAIAELGLEFTPVVNIMLLASGMVAGKAIGYAAWRKQGKPALNPDGTRMPRQSAPQRPPRQDPTEGMATTWEGPPDSGAGAESEPEPDE